MQRDELTGLECKIERIDARDDGLMTDLPLHYRYVLSRKGEDMQGYYSTGWDVPFPHLWDVMHCITSDLGILEQCPTAQDLADEMGFEPDLAESTFAALQSLQSDVDRLFPEWDYNDLFGRYVVPF